MIYLVLIKCKVYIIIITETRLVDEMNNFYELNGYVSFKSKRKVETYDVEDILKRWSCSIH